MGLFSSIKNMFSLMSEIKNMKEMTPEERERILSMSTEELSNLSDEDLLEAIDLRVDSKLLDSENVLDVFASLNEIQKAFAYVQSYDGDMVISIAYFFKGMNKVLAPYMSRALETLGAYDHKRLFDNFVRENGINLYDLSEFAVDGERQEKKLRKRYPIEQYDEEFSQLKNLDEYLVEYIRMNIKEF